MIIVFDLDDTLYDSMGAFRRSHKFYFPDMDVDPEELFERIRKYSYESLRLTAAGELKTEDEFTYRMSRAYAEYGITLDRAFCDEYEKLYREEQKKIVPFDRVDELLEILSNKASRLSILTNGLVEPQMNKYRRLDISKWIPEENVFVSDGIGIRKPDKLAFEEVERRLNGSKEEMIMVGDTYKADIGGAIEAGWRTLWFNHRNNPKPEDAANPTYEYHKMSELIDWANSL